MKANGITIDITKFDTNSELVYGYRKYRNHNFAPQMVLILRERLYDYQKNRIHPSSIVTVYDCLGVGICFCSGTCSAPCWPKQPCIV